MHLLRTAILAVLPLFGGISLAGTPSILVPADVKVAAQVDLDELKTNALGQQLIEGFRSGIAASLDADSESASPAEMIEALGFDPIAETHRITVLCSDFETAKENSAIVVELQQSTGNLEGLLLALPEYQSRPHRDYLIHSVVLDGDRLFGSVHTADDGTKRVIAAFAAPSVQRVLDHLDGQTGSELSRRLSHSSGTLVDVSLFEIPRQAITEPPFSVAAEMIQTAGLTLSDKNANLQINVNLVSPIEAQAEQLRQMIQGGVAMVNSMAREGSDPAMAMAASYLQGLTVQRDGKQVTITVEIPQDLLAEQLSAAMAN